MINKYLVHAAASEAMDGAAPDLERDAPWREKQHARGTACGHLVLKLWEVHSACRIKQSSAVHTVLRGRCSSVDELILSSTPALRHPWLRSLHPPQSTYQPFAALAPLQRELLLFQNLYRFGLGTIKQTLHQYFQQIVLAQSRASALLLALEVNAAHTQQQVRQI